MQTYLVGGAVRDILLGQTVHDRDWVVVGADADAMLQRGFRPVGKDFPVFLHPENHEEYALARTERKTAAGYTGFTFHADPSVSLEQDLQRRDLTINAMAMDENGQLIDPFGGKKDLENRILRHVSPAFAEDPVRILRAARFAARYGFHIASETLDLMRKMVQNGEVHALVAERVWQELAKGLMEAHPDIMFAVLRECGALAVILPEVEALFGVPQRAEYHPEIDTGVHTMMVLQQAAKDNLSLPERYAALTHDLGKALTPKDILPKHIGHDQRGLKPLRELNHRLRVPKACAELAELVCAFHIRLHQVGQIKHGEAVIKLLQEADAFRRPERFAAALRVCRADIRGRLGKENEAYPQAEHWLALLKAANSVATGDIARTHAAQPQRIAAAIATARCQAVQALQTAFTSHTQTAN